jgi:hypothetical protein
MLRARDRAEKLGEWREMQDEQQTSVYFRWANPED